MTRLFCLLAALWLAACTTDQAALVEKPATPAKVSLAAGANSGAVDDTAIPSQAGQSAQTPASQPAQPAAEKQNGSLEQASRDKPAAQPDPPARKAPPPALDIRTLVGMDRAGLSDLLGPPALLRTEVGAEVWQYSGKACVLHVFLYRDGANGAFRVAHVDAVHRRQRIAMTDTRGQVAPFARDCIAPPNRATARNQAS
ncbi:MAG: hypothetical protein QF384_11545 [Alphaproteobacteria bacterium]|nr:hypothetical protein [Alphaproteobacteria bacterium]MDP6830556.1 hypothetical protein [Alphaproteobacteria bacterium]MDP6875702.1 hypothetical protein [Alphaproteobacteria bacterium]